MNILHILNGDAPRPAMEQSSVPGTLSAWPDVLYEGLTPLATGDAWIRARSGYLGSLVPEPEAVIVEQYRANDAVLESWRDRDEVVFWLEHDLFDQLLLIRHLWWLGAKGAEGAGAKGAKGPDGAGANGAEGGTRFSLVCGADYIGMLKPEQFGPLFEARRPITSGQIRLGSRAWEAVCGDDPRAILQFADAADPELPYLASALRRLLEEFPSTVNGLARSERQILEVLAEGPRTPEQVFVAASRAEEAIYMGDSSFWHTVKRLNKGPHPLIMLDVQERPGRLPEGTLRITDTGRAVLTGRADLVALNGISRWLGGTLLTPERSWRWTGSSLLPPAL